MNKVIYSLFLIIIIAVISIFGSIVWWKAWLYHGWIGSPKWLFSIFEVDGESAYDLVMLEMFLICLFFVCLIFTCLRVLCKIKEK